MTLRLRIRNRDYEGFARIDPQMKTFWDSTALIHGCKIIDDRIAIQGCLQRAVLSRLQRSHPGQEAMVDTAQYLWWPRIHRDIVNLCKNCRECTKFGKNLKPMSPFEMNKPLPLLNAHNEELQLDYAGPLSDGTGNQVYILIAIDRSSKYPSAILTKTTGANKTLKFLDNCFFFHSIPKPIRTDQYSGFKNKLVDQYCKSIRKALIKFFCSVGDHRGCGLVDRSIQTIKRKLGTLQLEENPPDIHTALKMIIEDIPITKNSVTGLSPFEFHFGRKPNSEWSLATDNFKSKILLDEQNMERDLLTAEN